MTDEELIARQAKQIAELTDERDDLRACISKAICHMVCVGGPLNDNKLKFTSEQQKVFQAILNELE